MAYHEVTKREESPLLWLELVFPSLPRTKTAMPEKQSNGWDELTSPGGGRGFTMFLMLEKGGGGQGEEKKQLGARWPLFRRHSLVMLPPPPPLWPFAAYWHETQLPAWEEPAPIAPNPWAAAFLHPVPANASIMEAVIWDCGTWKNRSITPVFNVKGRRVGLLFVPQVTHADTFRDISMKQQPGNLQHCFKLGAELFTPVSI